MFRFLFTALLCAGIHLFFVPQQALAGTPSKGLKIDPLLEQAIRDTAEPEEIEEVDVEEVVAEEPVFEEEIVWEEPEPAPEPEPEPVVVAEVEEEPKGPREIGYKFNGMLFLPSVMTKTGWTDNVFTTDQDAETDYLTYVTPQLRIEIPDIKHDVEFEGSYELRKHLEYSTEDVTNKKARFAGQLNAEFGLSVPFSFAWQNTHEEREDDLARQLPTELSEEDDFKVTTGIAFKPGGFGIALLGNYQKQRYEDGVSKINNNPVIRQDANRDITEIEFNTSFDLDAENTLMLWGTVGDRDYEIAHFQNGGFNGPRRDSDTFSGMMSWIFDSGNIRGHMSVGVRDHNYDDVAIQDIREFVGDLEIDHQIGDLTSVNFQLARDVYEDEEVIDPIIRSRAGFYIDHQAWDDFMFAGGADYEYMEFNNSARDDEIWNFRLIADYFFNEIWAFGAEYVHTQRDSEQANLDFSRNMVLLRARGRL